MKNQDKIIQMFVKQNQELAKTDEAHKNMISVLEDMDIKQEKQLQDQAQQISSHGSAIASKTDSIADLDSKIIQQNKKLQEQDTNHRKSIKEQQLNCERNINVNAVEQRISKEGNIYDFDHHTLLLYYISHLHWDQLTCNIRHPNSASFNWRDIS